MEIRPGGIGKTSVTMSFPTHLTKHRPEPKFLNVGAGLALQMLRDFGPLDTDPETPLDWRLPCVDDGVDLPLFDLGVSGVQEGLHDNDFPSPDKMRPNTSVDYFLDQLDRVLGKE